MTPVPAVPEDQPAGDKTMVEVVAALADTYTDDGVAIVLSSPHKGLWPDTTTAEKCRTAEGRGEVWDWAQACAEGVFT